MNHQLNTHTLDKVKAISVRITDPELESKLDKLSKEQGLSLNMTINMLLGYAFNEVERTKKAFRSKIVFESE